MLRKTIKRLMDESGLSVQDVSDRSNVSISTINRILSGKTSDPGIQTVSAILEALGGSLVDIVDTGQPSESDDPKNVYYLAAIRLLENDLANKDRWIRRLTVIICFLVAFLVSYIILDAGTGAFGMIRY